MWTPKKLAHLEAMRNPPPKPRKRWQYVSRLGKHRLIPLEGESVWQLTPAEATWKRISDNLDKWNREHGRV